MPSDKIAKRTVDSLHPEGKVDYLWDTELSGFGVKVLPSGKKTYLVQYRLGGRGGRTRRYTIGKHGSPWTPDTARAEAKKILGAVAKGEDPAEEKTIKRNDVTVAQLCDVYLEKGVATKKASTVQMDKARIERHVKPLLGNRKVRQITRRDMEQFMLDVASGKTARNMKTEAKRGKSVVKGGKGAASRVMGMVGGIFSFAMNHGYCDINPVRGVKRFPDNKCERFLSDKELQKLGEVLFQAEKQGKNMSGIAAIRLLLLTGCRKSEILSLKWSYIDEERGYLNLPDSKTGRRCIRLGAAALDLLSHLPRFKNNLYVLPGDTEGSHYVGLQKLWSEMRDHAGLADVRVHDLRHSFASTSLNNGGNLYIIGKLLGHKNAASTQRYAHLADQPLQKEADRVASHISSIFELPKSDTIIKFKGF